MPKSPKIAHKQVSPGKIPSGASKSAKSSVKVAAQSPHRPAHKPPHKPDLKLAAKSKPKPAPASNKVAAKVAPSAKAHPPTNGTKNSGTKTNGSKPSGLAKPASKTPAIVATPATKASNGVKTVAPAAPARPPEKIAAKSPEPVSARPAASKAKPAIPSLSSAKTKPIMIPAPIRPIPGKTPAKPPAAKTKAVAKAGASKATDTGTNTGANPGAKFPNNTPVPQAPVPTDGKPKKNLAGFNTRDLEHFRELILAKRRELVGDMTSMEREALRSANGTNLSNLPLHMADMGTDNYEQEFTLGLVEKERGLLRELNRALAKIQDGTYGICEGTGKPISQPRLEAQPWARFSIEHARMMERGLVRRQ